MRKPYDRMDKPPRWDSDILWDGKIPSDNKYVINSMRTEGFSEQEIGKVIIEIIDNAFTQKEFNLIESALELCNERWKKRNEKTL